MGLRFPGAGPFAWAIVGSLLLSAASAAALRATAMRSRPGRMRALATVALAAGLTAGGLLGSSAGRRAAAACARELATGDGIIAVGAARESSFPSRSSRLTLIGATVQEGRGPRRCLIPRLVVRVDSVRVPIEAGARVTVRGEWVKIGRPSAWPRRPGRRGIVVGRLSETPSGAGRTADTSPGLPIRPLQAARARASLRLRRLLPADVNPLARALVLAERDDLPGALRTRFAEAGLAHLLAISGLHVGLIGAAIALLLRSVVGPLWSAAGTAAAVAVYVAAIGAPPSAVRATLLLAGWSAARIRGLPSRPWDLLGGAALVAIVADPMVLAEPGFQLSFAGFAGLGLGAALWRLLVAGRARGRPPGEGILRRLPRRASRRLGLVGLAIASSTGAFAATAPIAAAHFHHVAPAALISHFAGAPLVAAAIGALAMTLLLPAPLDAISAGAATTVVRVMIVLADGVAGLPGAHTSIGPPSAAGWAAIGLALAGLWQWLRLGHARAAVPLLAAGAAVALAAPALTTRVPGGLSLICTLDVGQGDAAVLRTDHGRWILFDAGPRFGGRDAGRDVVLPLLRRYGARRIDLFVLSHPDLDHLGGFASIHASVPVFRVLDSGHPAPKRSYARFLARTEDDRIRWLPAEQGNTVSLDNVTIRVLGPSLTSFDGDEIGANETSLLLRVSIGRALVYLNTGDATTAAEHELLSNWGPDSVRADLLKVGHHGSRSSTASAFLSAVRPSVAVISAGRGNAYGHPHPAVLDRLAGAGIPRVWRTDRDGTLCLEVDAEKGWRVQGEREWTRPREAGTRLDVTKG